jgi:hypothetical protein
MLLIANLQTSAAAKHITRPNFSESGVLTKAEGDSQHGDSTTELHTCSGCVTNTEGSLEKHQLHNGSEEKKIGNENLGKLVVNFLLSWIKMLLTNLAKLFSEWLSTTELHSGVQNCPNFVPQCAYLKVVTADRLYSQLRLT